jgi:8-oxo-dGDP phosphatase
MEVVGSTQVDANPWMSVREDTVLEILPSMSALRCRVLVATRLTPCAPDRDLEEQDMRSAWFHRSEVERMIGDGTITDAESVAAYSLLALRGDPAIG